MQPFFSVEHNLKASDGVTVEHRTTIDNMKIATSYFIKVENLLKLTISLSQELFKVMQNHVSFFN